MNLEEYKNLVKEFGLDFEEKSHDSFYKNHPVCGWRGIGNSFWKTGSVIMFDEYVTSKGSISGLFNGQCATLKYSASVLITERIQEIKSKMNEEKLKKIEKDFE